MDLEFLGEAVKRFEEDESIKPAFIAAVEEMSRDLAAMTINDDYKSYLTVYYISNALFSRCLSLTYLGFAKPGW